MKTDTLKQIGGSIAVGLIFAIPLNYTSFVKTGIIENLGQFAYMFFVLGGTFFLTGQINNKRGRKTANMRIFAKKMKSEGILVMDDQAEMIREGEKSIKGWLYLTNRLLIFANTPDPELIEKKALRVSVSKISKIETFKPTILSNDGLIIKLQKGQDYVFHVGKASLWNSKIMEIKNNKHKNKDVQVEGN